jgi:hypothetical protein
MATRYISGAIGAILSHRQEFKDQPIKVRKIFAASAYD